jgi:hypothetical protein
VLGSTGVALEQSTVKADVRRQSPAYDAAVALEEALGIAVALVNKAAVDKDTMVGHSAARGVVGESEVEDNPRRGVAGEDTDRHIRSAFCCSDI